jgi:NitT/TauT family transport system substrate-binding protein
MTGRIFIMAALLALPALPAAAQKPQEGVQEGVSVAHVLTLAHAPYYLALERGYFGEEGIKIDESTVRSAQDVQSMLATGKLDVSMGAVSTAFFNAQSQGLDLRITAALGFQGEPQAYTRILVRKDLWDSGAVKSGKDLKTRKVGVIRNSLPEYLLVIMLEKYGMTITDVDEVNLGFPEMSIALRNKGIDAAIMPDPFAATVIAERDAALLVPEARTGIGDLSTAVFFSGEFMRQRPAVAVRFLRALLRAAPEVQGAYNKKPELASLLASATKLSVAAIELSMPPGFDPSLDIAKFAASLRNQERIYMALGRLTYASPLPMDRLIDARFIREAGASFEKK